MLAVAFPESVDVTAGADGHVALTITNTSEVIDAFRVQVFGLDPDWVTVEPARLSLFPGQTEQVDIRVELPVDYPASQRNLSINVTSDDDPDAFVLTEVALAVQPRTLTSVRVDPVTVTGGRSARFGLVVTNVGNAVATATPFATDPEDLAEFRFEPPRVDVAPGREQVIEITAHGGRSWFGQPRARTFTFGVDAEQRVETLGTFVQRPRISRWLISLLGLLTAAAVFAAVLSRTFDRVVDEARVSPAVLDAALQRDAAGGAVIPADPGGVAGRLVSASTGSGLAGAQAELYVVGATDTPVGSAATDTDGAFTFPNLGAGEYVLHVAGAGIDSIWYGGATAAADAETIDVELGAVTELATITISGTPVDVTGTITVAEGVEPADTTVSVIVPGVVASSTDATTTDGDASAGTATSADAVTNSPVVAEATLAPDGSFTLSGVPSPGTYQLLIEQPGSPPEVRDLVLEPGRELPPIEAAVQPGNGLISGSVSGPAGPLGGATVTATDGSTEIATASLTEGAVGSFSLRDLPIPGQYNVLIEHDDYDPASRTISLTDDDQAGTFSARLVPASGSISGRATLDGSPARGLAVTITGGDVERTVGVVSQGPDAGSYAITGLPAPATYTLNFGGDGTIPQVRVVDLDPDSGRTDITGIDVSLSHAATEVGGAVSGPDGQALAGATVVLSDGSEERTLTTAHSPLGAFRFSGVEPGAYTLSASRTGTEPVVVLVNVAPGETVGTVDLQLGAQAGIAGSVVGFDPAVEPLPVRLFLPAQFPRGTPVAATTIDADGRYSFPGLEAPETYVVAVYAGPTAADPLDSATLRTEPGRTIPAPDFTVTPP